MRRTLALILLFSAIAMAATPEEFTQPFLQPGEYSNSRGVVYGAQQYHIVWVNATPTFVLKLLGETYVFINDTSTIHAVLLRDFLNTVHIETEVASLNSSMNSFQSQRMQKENACEVLTGTDHAACYDGESCLQACLSVPSCRAYNQPSGGALVAEVLSWRQQHDMMDGNISRYMGNLSLVAARSDQMDVAASSMETLIEKLYPPITQITTVNKLFRECGDCFNYCLPIVFNKSLLDTSKGYISQLRGKLAPMSSFGSQAENLRRETISRTERSRFTLLLIKMEAETGRLSDKAASLFPRIRDDEAAYNLTRIQSIYSQVRTYGEAKNYEPAFALEPQFDAIIAPLDARLAQLQATLDRYDAMMSRVNPDLFNATLNSNNALLMINDTSLEGSLEKMRNLSGRMQSLANESKYADAFELEDDYFWESGQVNTRIMNITVQYVELTSLQSNAATILNQTNGKLRPDDGELRENYTSLTGRFNLILAEMRPPLQPSNIPQLRSNLQQVSSDATALSQLVDRTHRIRDRQTAYRQAENMLKGLFFAWPKAW